MCRRKSSVMLLGIAMLVTGCRRPSAETTFAAGSNGMFHQEHACTPSTQGLDQNWAGLCGSWCAPSGLPPGEKGLARCEVSPILNDHFLSCRLTLSNDRGELGMCLSFVIMRDASSGAFKCWGLVSSGEHMAATLVRPNQRSWIWSFSGVRPDGVTGTATHSWTLLDDDTLVWEVRDRKWDNGTRSPDLLLKLKRDRGTTATFKTPPHAAGPEV